MTNANLTDNAVAIFGPAQNFKPITLTAAAVKHVQKKIAQRGAGIGLRFSTKKAGCSGLEYLVDYVDARQDDEVAFPFAAGLAVYVHATDLIFLHGTEIDYVQKGIAGGELKFNNPNAKVSCGCGESFNI